MSKLKEANKIIESLETTIHDLIGYLKHRKEFYKELAQREPDPIDDFEYSVRKGECSKTLQKLHDICEREMKKFK